MDLLIAQLEQKYKAFNRRPNNDDSTNSLLFDSAFEYFSITEKQPKIKEIVENARKDLEMKKQEIKNISEGSQKEIIARVERHSLYFCYNEILRDMYTPMMKYKNSSSQLTPKDIIGDTKVWREGFLDTVLFIVKYFVKHLSWTKRSDSELNASVALMKIEYTFRQEKYEIYFDRVHKELIPRLLEISTQKLINTPLVVPLLETIKGVSFDPESSVLTIGGKRVEIKLKNDNPNSYYVLELMFKDTEKIKDSFYYSEMADELLDTPLGDKEWRAIYRACLDIQNKVRKATKIEDFLIIKTGKTGYIQINSNYL